MKNGNLFHGSADFTRKEKGYYFTAENFDADAYIGGEIADLLLSFGFPSKIKGYRYLRESVRIAVGNINGTDGISENIYGLVAEKFGAANVKSVERACSYAIEVACNSGKFEKINAFLGTNVYSGKYDKPSPSEFISLISDKLRMKYKK